MQVCADQHVYGSCVGLFAFETVCMCVGLFAFETVCMQSIFTCKEPKEDWANMFAALV